jgi:hypothetical protein
LLHIIVHSLPKKFVQIQKPAFKHVDHITVDYEATIDTGDSSYDSTYIASIFTSVTAIAAGTLVTTVSILGWIWNLFSTFLSITRSRFKGCAVCAQRRKQCRQRSVCLRGLRRSSKRYSQTMEGQKTYYCYHWYVVHVCNCDFNTEGSRAMQAMPRATS